MSAYVSALGSAQDLLELFCRVENLPRNVVEQWLHNALPWSGVGAYLDHLERLALGPNVAALLGHSSLRLHVMGLERSVREPRASAAELAAMARLAEEALAAGYAGISIPPEASRRAPNGFTMGISPRLSQIGPGFHPIPFLGRARTRARPAFGGPTQRRRRRPFGLVRAMSAAGHGAGPDVEESSR